MGMIGYAKAGGEMARVFRLLTATVGMLAILPISAESADDLKPPVGYRRLFRPGRKARPHTTIWQNGLVGVCCLFAVTLNGFNMPVPERE